jgi:hypothetical protein
MTIKIDLTKPSNGGVISHDELIQKISFDKLVERIAVSISTAKENRRSDQKRKTIPGIPDSVGGGMVFFIDGTRGAGKSTFLRSVIRAITETMPRSAIPTLEAYNIRLVAEIDPTKIATGEHILLTILQKIHSLVERDNRSNVDIDAKQEAIRRNFKRVARGLALLREQHSALKHLDPEAILDIGMERAQSGAELADHISGLIDEVCRYLEADALVLAIDDADTNFTEGKQILETIRCYLESPRLIILMTGDLEMYTHLVREKFKQDMGAAPRDKDEIAVKRHEMLLDHLQDQYLMKMFPILNRVHLQPLSELHKKISYEVVTRIDGESEPLFKCMQGFVKAGFSVKEIGDINKYVAFILNLPLRSVIQWLQTCANASEVNPQLMAECMRAMVLGSIYAKGLNIDALSAGDFSSVQSAFFDLVVDNGDFDTGCYMRPQSLDDAIKNCFVTLAAEIARHTDGRPGLTLNFLLQGPGSTSMFNLVRKDLKDIRADEQSRVFKDYLAIGHAEDALNWAWHISPLVSTSGARLIQTGVIGMRMKSHTASDKTLKKVFGKMKSAHKPALALTVNYAMGGANSAYISIFNVIGLMARLLEESVEILEKESSDEEQCFYEFMVLAEKHFSRIDGGLTVSVPVWKQSANSRTFDTDSLSSDFDESTSKIEWNALIEPEEKWENSNLVKATASWLLRTRKYRDEVKPSAVMIGKIWTRLYFALESCSDNIRAKKDIGVASIMRLYAWCLINAVFVEERYHHCTCKSEVNVWRNNPVQINGIEHVKREILAIQNLDDDFPLTSIVATCPLILGLLPLEDLEVLLALGGMSNQEQSTVANTCLSNESEQWKELDNLAIVSGVRAQKNKQNSTNETKQ